MDKKSSRQNECGKIIIMNRAKSVVTVGEHSVVRSKEGMTLSEVRNREVQATVTCSNISLYFIHKVFNISVVC